MFVDEMYIGEEKRDASSKVRGFIYQDLLAVEQLIDSKDETNELYSEWAEDIYCESDSTIIITQAKYYTSDNINFSEIYSELYYQYLRLKLLDCEKRVTCKLSYYSKNQDKGVVTKEHVLDNIKKNGFKMGEVDLEKLSAKDKKQILDSAYYFNDKKRKKSERERFLYEYASSSKVLEDFITNIYVEDFRNNVIEDFREELKNKIYKEVYSNTRATQIEDWREEVISDIFIAISVSYIQQSYDESNNAREERKRTKGELINKLISIVNGSSELNIIPYLIQCYIDECLIDYVLEDESLEENKERKEIIKFYENLAASTKEFFYEYLIDDEAQFALLNTISRRANKLLNKESYLIKSLREKSEVFMEHRESFMSFLQYSWKILFDIGCDEFSKYIKKNCLEYIRFDFEGQTNTVILSLSNNPLRDGEHVHKRFRQLKNKPSTWFWKNNRIRGFRNYELDIKHISEELKNNTAYISQDMFKIECLECIKTEEEFANKENCNNCIFSEECVRGEK